MRLETSITGTSSAVDISVFLDPLRFYKDACIDVPLCQVEELTQHLAAMHSQVETLEAQLRESRLAAEAAVYKEAAERQEALLGIHAVVGSHLNSHNFQCWAIISDQDNKDPNSLAWYHVVLSTQANGRKAVRLWVCAAA